MKLVLFDCDGTLVDSQHVILEAMARAFAGAGLAVPPRETVLGIVGLSLTEAMRRIGGEDPAFPAEELAELYRGAFRTLRTEPGFREPLYPGIAEVIATLARRDDVLIGMATGKSQRGAQAVLAHHGLTSHFVTVQTADDDALVGHQFLEGGQPVSVVAPAVVVFAPRCGRRDLVGEAGSPLRPRERSSLLEHHGLASHFVTVQTADDAPSKPHPEMVLRAMAETGAAPLDTILIGDTSFDMTMARAAGVRAVGVTWGYHARDVLVQSGAERLVDHASSLPVVLDELWMEFA